MNNNEQEPLVRRLILAVDSYVDCFCPNSDIAQILYQYSTFAKRIVGRKKIKKD